VVGGHGESASGVGGDFEPVVAGPFDPVFDGLVDGLMSSGVETDGAPVSIGIINGKCSEIIDYLILCFLFEKFIYNLA